MHVVLLFIVVFFVNVYGIYYQLQFKYNKSNRLVLLILLIVFLQFLTGLLIRFSYPAFINLFLAFPFSLLFGPFIFLLYKQYINARIPQKYYLHFLPFCLAFSVFVFLAYNAPFRYEHYDKFFRFSNILSAIIYLSYIIWIVFRLEKMEASLIRLLKIWKRLMIPTFLIIIFLFSVILLQLEGGDLNSYQCIKLIFLLLLLFPVIQFSYLKTPLLDDLSAMPRITAGKKQTTIHAFKNREPVVLPVEVEFLYRKKVELFILAKGYLDIDLNREQFCKQLDIKKNDLGPFLKKSYKTNFNGFINQLRLVYASRLLSQEEFVYTIDDLSFICGFNSRASFYRNFITEFGCSPHQYRTTVQHAIKN